jgi:hypothetical protein
MDKGQRLTDFFGGYGRFLNQLHFYHRGGRRPGYRRFRQTRFFNIDKRPIRQLLHIPIGGVINRMPPRRETSQVGNLRLLIDLSICVLINLSRNQRRHRHRAGGHQIRHNGVAGQNGLTYAEVAVAAAAGGWLALQLHSRP